MPSSSRPRPRSPPRAPPRASAPRAQRGRRPKHKNDHSHRTADRLETQLPQQQSRGARSKNAPPPPPREARVDAASVACRALTAPSALGEASVETPSEGDDSHRHRPGRSEKPHRPSSGGRRGSDEQRGSRSASSNRHREASALSMRKQGKRPWFASPSHGKTNGSAGGTSFPGSGVPYRTATSTHRALEEVKRKRLEVQERRRAVSILVLLGAVAGAVHFAGQGGVGLWDGFVGGSTVGKAGVRGSRDRMYGETKEVGYGGERAGLAPTGAQGAAGDRPPSAGQGEGDIAAATIDGAAADIDEEWIPPPVEKDYDPAHAFLLPLRHFADVADPHRPSDAAFFFHVPRAGGSTIKDIVGKCLKLVQSSEVGVRDGHDADPTLGVVDVHESKYVNVDTTTIPGIQRAVDLGLAASGLADVVVSSYLHESAALFDLTHQGRAMILLRDPIERATSMYWHRVKEVGDLDASTTIEDYAQGNGIENNWMCRFLADRMTGELTKEDLERAKEILKDKFLVGFLDDLDESVHRMMKYNGWNFSTDDTDKMKEEDCIHDLTSAGGGSNVNPHEYELPKRGSQAHALISWQTQFDLKLYAYAKEIFEHQTKEWGSKERKKLLKKEKKKKGG